MAGVPGAEVAAILRAQPWPQNWTPLEVRRWLEAIALEAYAPTFEAAGVQGADLIGMDADALKRRLGVAHLGHRTKLLKEIAILSNRAMLSMRRGEDGKAKDFAQKRKELKDIVYPDRVRRELKAQQDEKLLEARAGFWTPAAARRCQKSTMGNQGKAWSAAQNCKQPNDDLLITKGVATANLRVGDDQHRTQTWGADPAQQRALVRPSTGRRQRGQRGVRPQTAGTRQVEDRAEATGGWQDGSGEEAGETEVFIKPTDKIVQVVEKIKQYEAEANYDKLIKAWVEYGACVRIEYSDKDRLLVRTHFNLATTYLRQKLTAQALYHFKEADLLNQENAHTEDALFFKCRIMEGMGICETRLGHFKAADTLLEQARRVCLRKVLGKDSIDENALTELPEDEEINDSDGTVASVWVAKSELYSAQAEYDKAEKSLLLAYSLKERQLGDKDTQIGKLCSALGTICQKKVCACGFSIVPCVRTLVKYLFCVFFFRGRSNAKKSDLDTHRCAIRRICCWTCR